MSFLDQLGHFGMGGAVDYDLFVDEIVTNSWLPPCCQDAFGRPSSPLELLIMGSLALLGGGVTFLFLQDMTYISETVHRMFFEEFLAFGEKVLFAMFVKAPTTPDEIEQAMRPYQVSGLPGVIGSVDCTHIPLENVPYALKHRRTGKEKYPSRSFEMTCLNNGLVIHCTCGFEGAQTDKTIVMRDEFVMDIHYKRKYADLEWKRFDQHGVEHVEKGCHLICDNGYPDFLCLVAPVSSSQDESLNLWSRHMESTRKDIETLFGRLKKRFGMLRGVRFQSLVMLDHLVHTCCALHNIILLAREEQLVQYELASNSPPTHRVYSPAERHYSGGRSGVHRSQQTTQFRDKLVGHFAYLYARDQVFWPLTVAERMVNSQ